jgi:hypothetical protein
VSGSDGVTVRQFSPELAEASSQRPFWEEATFKRALTVVTVLGLGVPVVAYVWLIARYGVNAIFGDQWSDVRLIGLSRSDHLSLAALWAQHNENRIFFPNLIVVFLGDTTHFNIHIEMYLSGVMCIASVGLLIWTHKRRSPPRHWIYYCPVAIILLSFIQYGNTLWGFQMAWYLVMLALAVSLFLVDWPTLTWPILAAAIAAAIVGSFSSLQGLLIWPAGLVLLYHRRRSTPKVLAWIGSAAATATLYFYNFNPDAGSPYHKFAIEHPVNSFKFVLFLLGDVVGVQLAPGAANGAVEWLGAAILIVAVIAVVTCGLRRDDTGAAPLGVALIIFGILFAGMVTQGRVFAGLTPQGAGASRYTSFDLLVLAGSYLALLARPRGARTESSDYGGVSSVLESLLGRSSDHIRVRRPTAFAAVWVVLITAMTLQVLFGLGNGLVGSRNSNAVWTRDEDVTVNAAKVSDGALKAGMGLIGGTPAEARRLVQIAQRDHLSLFATNAVEKYSKEGVTP